MIMVAINVLHTPNKVHDANVLQKRVASIVGNIRIITDYYDEADRSFQYY